MFSKKPPYLINIPQPCHENWQGMAAADKGRFCQACSTVVKDFTGLSDAEIISELRRANGKLCGRFLETQLNRELKAKSFVLTIPRPGLLSRIAASALLFNFFVNQVSAHQKSTPAAQHISANGTTAKGNSDTTHIIIKGKLLNYHNNLPLKNLEVEIKGTGYKCVTDIYGRFKFQLPDNFKATEVVVTPAASAVEFLDTSASFIPDEKVMVDTFPFKRSVNLYRYPLEAIPVSIYITSSSRLYKGQVVVAQPVDVAIVDPLTALPSPVMPGKKEGTLQRLRNFLRRKKNGA